MSANAKVRQLLLPLGDREYSRAERARKVCEAVPQVKQASDMMFDYDKATAIANKTPSTRRQPHDRRIQTPAS